MTNAFSFICLIFTYLSVIIFTKLISLRLRSEPKRLAPKFFIWRLIMAQSKGSNIAESVKAIAEPIAENFGVRIWDVRFLKEGAEWYLRIFIDKENGVNITDCENVSRAIDPILDEKDFISQNYILEVSSPGLERELVRDEHFEEYIGKDIKVRLIRPMEGLGKEFCGVLKEANGAELTIEDYSGENQVTINKKDTAWVKADDLDI